MFRSARIKLTAWYLLIIMLISLCFSVLIYTILVGEVERFDRAQRIRIERRYQQGLLPPLPVQPIPQDIDLVNDFKQRLLLILIAVNGGILLASGTLGYQLAGITLRPIKIMVDEQNRFISDASHELRTPLTALKSSMEVFLRDKNAGLAEARDLMKDSIKDVDHLTALSTSLLQLAQYQKPKVTMKMESIPLKKVIEESVDKVSLAAKAKEITISCFKDDYYVKGNKQSLNELFTILMDNAVKYSDEGASININSERHDGFVQVKVSDTGIGIAEKDLPHLFERFYRVDQARSEKKRDGYGLGLSIAKRITDLHHGSISVSSEVNKGTTFTVGLLLAENNSL